LRALPPGLPLFEKAQTRALSISQRLALLEALVYAQALYINRLSSDNKEQRRDHQLGETKPKVQGPEKWKERNQDLLQLPGSAPSDFHGTNRMFYFTPEAKVAEMYAGYLKTWGGPLAIVYLRIPNITIERMAQPYIQRLYWPSDDWKKFLWRCRTDKHIPTRLRKYIEG
jgi:hypothetical protein